MDYDMDFQSNLYQDSIMARITLITTASIGVLGGVILGVEASKYGKIFIMIIVLFWGR